MISFAYWLTYMIKEELISERKNTKFKSMTQENEKKFLNQILGFCTGGRGWFTFYCCFCQFCALFPILRTFSNSKGLTPIRGSLKQLRSQLKCPQWSGVSFSSLVTCWTSIFTLFSAQYQATKPCLFSLFLFRHQEARDRLPTVAETSNLEEIVR